MQVSLVATRGIAFVEVDHVMVEDSRRLSVKSDNVSRCWPLIVVLCLSLGHAASRADDANTRLGNRFADLVLPFLTSYCVNCHGGERPKARFDLSVYRTLDDVVKGYGDWEHVLEMLTEGEMPPDEAKEQPSAGQRESIIKWIQAI